jgi:hypothetical protein
MFLRDPCSKELDADVPELISSEVVDKLDFGRTDWCAHGRDIKSKNSEAAAL